MSVLMLRSNRKRQTGLGLCAAVLVGAGALTLPAQNNTYAADAGLPGPMVRAADTDAKVREMRQKLKSTSTPTYAAYRNLAERLVEIGSYDQAAAIYRTEAQMYRNRAEITPSEKQRIMLNASAIQVEKIASRYDTSTRIFIERPLNNEELDKLNTRKVIEPPLGVLLGAYINLEDNLGEPWYDSRGRILHTHKQFTNFAKRPHASYFIYIEYGLPVPYEWLEQCKKEGVIPQIALEPQQGLDKVKDDAYLKDFAQFCGRLNWPIFLRYASEMNGSWTRWNGNPALYKEKFQLVHRTFKKYAPLVATVWCVNSVPDHVIQDYYPGDDYCDWVGVNVYSVPYYSNNPKDSGLMDTALPFLDPIYNVYSQKKPIAICEFGASFMGAADMVPRPDYAVSRMKYLYEALPRFYPRIKMIDWFSVNTIRHGSPASPNNYSLTENKELGDAYKKIVQEPYFIDGTQWPQYLGLSSLIKPRTTALENPANASSPKATFQNVAATRGATRSTARPPAATTRGTSRGTTQGTTRDTTRTLPSAPAGGGQIINFDSWKMPCLVSLGQEVQDTVKFNLWIRTPLERPKIFFALNKVMVYTGEGNGVHDVEIDANKLSGSQRARVYVYDEKNRFVSTAAITIEAPAPKNPKGSATRQAERGPRRLQLSGSVQRYYVDRAGYVSAVDVETLGAVERIYFNPGMAQSLMANYPQFSEISAWVIERAKPKTNDKTNDGIRRSWNLIGLGEELKDEFPPYTKTDIELLEEGLKVMDFTRLNIVTGKVTDILRNDEGAIVALIVAAPNGNAQAGQDRLVQIPARLRALQKPAAGTASAEAVLPIEIGSQVRAVVVPAPQQPGEVILAYPERYNTDAIAVNGQKAASLYTTQKRFTSRDVVRTSSGEGLPEEVSDATARGLRVYAQPPVAPVEPLDDAILKLNRRPW